MFLIDWNSIKILDFLCQNQLYVQTTKWFKHFKFADDVSIFTF